MQRVCRVLATAVFTVVGLHSVNADTIIDNYSTNQPLLFVLAVGPSLSNSVASPAGSVASGAGDSRTMTIQETSGSGIISGRISGGEFGFGSGGATTGQFHVDYNLSNNPLNLISATKITMAGNFDTSAVGTSLGVKLSDGINMFTQAFSLSSPSPFSQDFLLSGFTGVNLGHIRLISFGTYDSSGNLVNATPDADIRVNLFTSDTTAVPEPASMAIWAVIGIVGAAYSWRRRGA